MIASTIPACRVKPADIDHIKSTVDDIYEDVTSDKISGLVSRINIKAYGAVIEVTPYPVVGSEVNVTSDTEIDGEAWIQTKKVETESDVLRFNVPGQYEYTVKQTYQDNLVSSQIVSVSNNEFSQISMVGATIFVKPYQPQTGTIITGTGGGQNYKWTMDDTTVTPVFYVPGGKEYTFTQTNAGTKIGEVTVSVTDGESTTVAINAAKLTVKPYDVAVGTVLQVVGTNGETQTKTISSLTEQPVFYVPGGSYTLTQIYSGEITGTADVTVASGEAKVVTMGPYFTDLKSATWDMVKNIVNKGQAAKFLNAGDKKTVTLSTGEQVTFVAAGVNTYDGAVDFIAENCLENARVMNSSYTNQGGFASSALKSWLNETFLGWLPSDLQNVITAKPVYTAKSGNDGTIVSADCKVWIPTEYEMFGKTTYSRSEEASRQKHYPIFTNDASRVKKLGANGSALRWWEASPVYGDTKYFCAVDSDGSAHANAGAYYDCGVVPGFRILRES